MSDTKTTTKPPVINETPSQLRRMNASLQDKLTQLEKEMVNRHRRQEAVEENNKYLSGELANLKRELAVIDKDCAMSIVYSENKPVQITMEGLWTVRKFHKIYRQIIQEIRMEITTAKKKMLAKLEKIEAPEKTEKEK